MLVCNVSQLRRRAAIQAGIVETAAALDAPGTGNVIFATLVDDPASVGEHVDAFLGQIMVEAASASTVLNAGLIYKVGIVEALTAADQASATTIGIVNGTVVESATATDTPDASATSGARFEGVLASNGPIMPANPQPAVIYIEG